MAAPASVCYAPACCTPHSVTTAREVRENQFSPGSYTLVVQSACFTTSAPEDGRHCRAAPCSIRAALTERSDRRTAPTPQVGHRRPVQRCRQCGPAPLKQGEFHLWLLGCAINLGCRVWAHLVSLVRLVVAQPRQTQAYSDLLSKETGRCLPGPSRHQPAGLVG